MEAHGWLWTPNSLLGKQPSEAGVSYRTHCEVKEGFNPVAEARAHAAAGDLLHDNRFSTLSTRISKTFFGLDSLR